MLRRADVLIAAALIITVSCGGDGSLGSIDGKPITTEEYLSVFNALPASEQVDVLSPGGRMALMDRIVRKRLLIAAWEEDQSVSEGWEDIYRTSFLADSMLYRLAADYDHQAYLDSVASLGISSFTLRAVLVTDSIHAVETAQMWNEGDYTQVHPSISAPWSTPDGSSYRTMGGPVHMLGYSFTPLLQMEHGRAHVLPMFGAWAVCQFEPVSGEWQPDDAASSSGFMAHVAAASRETVLAEGVSSIAGNCRLEGTTLLPVTTHDDTPVILHSRGMITAGEILTLMNRMNPWNFAGPVPDELSAMKVPDAGVSKELTVWFYVSSVARRHSLAEMAVEEGVTLPEGALDYARAESVVRERVLYPAIADSSVVESWYLSNVELFMYPERRSVLLGYTDSTSAASAGPASDFTDLLWIETLVDSSGRMIPTPIQPMEVFGPILGQAIFDADSGVLTGPVFTGGELAAWFKVVEIAPPSQAPLEDVFDLAVMQAPQMRFEEGFAQMMADLENSYPVTVDTQAVERIDLWGDIR